MPLSGIVAKVNPELECEPQLINNDPYGEGWMIKIECSDPSEIDRLLSADAYKQLL